MAVDPVSFPAAAMESRVLLLPPTRRDAQAISRFLEAENISFLVCPSMTALCAAVGEGAGAVLLSEEAIIAEPTEFTNCIARQPVWSDLPTMVLSKSGTETPRLTAALPHLRNVSVLERPVRITTLLSHVRSSLRGRARQYEVREHLRHRELAELDLRNSEERLRLAVQTGRLGVWEIDLRAQTMNCSATCRETFGRPMDEPFEYDDFWNAVHVDDRDRVHAAFVQAIEQQAAYDFEFRNIWPDGSGHWVLVRGRPTSAGNGSTSRIVGVTLDITGRKTAEELRATLLTAERAARTEAERAGRMKDEFLATLSHELRTPLNAILGWSQILASGSRDEADLTEGLQTIERNARAQTQIIEDLLDMSRIISGKVRLDVKPVDLNAVVQAAIATVRHSANAKAVKIDFEFDAGAAMTSGDPNRLQQVFWNLLSNAVKFTPSNGRVHVSLARVGSEFEIKVADTGEGISAEFLPYVFDRFRQADATTTRRHGGLGLGLAIVKQLVESHGGTLRAHSDGQGQGATFSVRLPATSVASDASPASDRKVHQSVFNSTQPLVQSQRGDGDANISGANVLVVDDEADSRALIERLLVDQGATVSAAGSVREAMTLILAHRFDLIVSDIGMPNEDGYALIRQLRMLSTDLGGQTPAVALTAYARSEDRERVLKAGFQRHLTKPVDPNELVGNLASLLRDDVVQ